MTTESFRVPARRLWRLVEVIGTLLAMGTAALVMLGWRFEKPGERITVVEARVTTIESAIQLTASQLELLVRLQCLQMSRREANLAGACKQHPTREESTRVVSLPQP